MSAITFKALLTSIHIDPVKGTQKIQLIPTSYVSVDKLSSLGPRDESIRVTLESAQTRLDVDDPIVLGEEDVGIKLLDKLEAAADDLRDPNRSKREEEERSPVDNPERGEDDQNLIKIGPPQVTGKVSECIPADEQRDEAAEEDEAEEGGSGGII